MDFDVVKEVCVEFCENTYALGVNYLIDHEDNELKTLLHSLIILNDHIRTCEDINKLFNYKKKLEQLVNRIEVIINAF